MIVVIPSRVGILPLNPSFSALRTNPCNHKASLHSYYIPFPPHFRCMNSHQHTVACCRSSVADRVLMDIHYSGIIACLRAQSAEVAIEAARAAFRGGISVLEITMSTPGVFEALQCLVQEYPSKSIGFLVDILWLYQLLASLDRQSAKDALKHGAKFLMSPAMVKGILDDVEEGQALYIPGAMIPTEILSAYDAGARIIKVYPVSAVGGVEYIAAVKKPFSRIPMVASQGITIDSLGQYISQGASSVVLSDAIFDKKAMAQRDFVVINQLASIASIKANEAVS